MDRSGAGPGGEPPELPGRREAGQRGAGRLEVGRLEVGRREVGPLRAGRLEVGLLVAALVAVGISAAEVSTGVRVTAAVVVAVTAFLAGRSTGRAGPALIALAAAVAAGAVTMVVAPSAVTAGTVLAAVAVFAGMLPWLAGFAWRQSAALVQAGWDRAEQLDRERRLVAEQARLRERTRIAQDMHDALGHELSLIALRAGALKLAPGLDPVHRAAADELRASAGAAVERLGAVIGLLHDPASPASPAAGADAVGAVGVGAALPALVGRAASAGMAVKLTVEGRRPVAADPRLGPALHRVVQESLTNAAKHAPGAEVTVTVRHAEGWSSVRVVNRLVAGAGGPPARVLRPSPTGGLGLIGLHERVRLSGGTLKTGVRDGRWVVSAHLPHTPGPLSPLPAEEVTAHRHRARRRVSRAILALVVLPLVSFTLLTAGLWLWAYQVTGREVLDPGVYAGLRVGQERDEFATALPRRQAGNPPPAVAPDGATCEYYSVTRNPFDSRSGDAYRLCFRDNRLISLDMLRW